MSKSRLNQIERLLNKLNPDSEEYARLDAEANELVEAVVQVEDIIKQEMKQKEEAQKAKIAEIKDLYEGNKTGLLFDKYGHEFIDDYKIEGNTVFSLVARESQNSTWETEEPEQKVKQLVSYRIYNHYVR